jgi:hypothetical protein
VLSTTTSSIWPHLPQDLMNFSSTSKVAVAMIFFLSKSAGGKASGEITASDTLAFTLRIWQVQALTLNNYNLISVAL